jgi:hypothetical protein
MSRNKRTNSRIGRVYSLNIFDWSKLGEALYKPNASLINFESGIYIKKIIK